MSQVQVPPVVSRGHVHTSRGHIPTSGMYIPTSRAYIPTYRVSHGTSHTMTYGPYYGTQYGQGSSPYGCGYQQPSYSPNYRFVALNSQGTPHYGASMPPYMGQMGRGHYGQYLTSIAYWKGLISGVKLSIVVPQAIGICLHNIHGLWLS